MRTKNVSPIPFVSMILFLLLGVVLSVGPLHGQAEQTDQLRQLLELQDDRQPLEDYESGEDFDGVRQDAAEDIGEQEILRERPTHEPFRVLGSLNERITDNAALSPFTENSDLLTTVTGGMEYTPFRGGRGRPDPIRFRLRSQLFRYRDNSSLDFNRYELGIRGAHRKTVMGFPLYFRGGYAYEQFRYGSSSASADRGDLIRSFHVLEGSVYYIHSFTRYQALIPELATEVEFTDDVDGRTNTRDDNEKNNVSASLTYYYEYSRKLSVYALARYRHSRYDYVLTADGERRDDNRGVTAGAEWSFNDWSNVRLNVSHSKNNSNSPFFEYDVSNIGGRLNVRYDF